MPSARSLRGTSFRFSFDRAISTARRTGPANAQDQLGRLLHRLDVRRVPDPIEQLDLRSRHAAEVRLDLLGVEDLVLGALDDEQRHARRRSAGRRDRPSSRKSSLPRRRRRRSCRSSPGCPRRPGRGSRSRPRGRSRARRRTRSRTRSASRCGRARAPGRSPASGRGRRACRARPSPAREGVPIRTRRSTSSVALSASEVGDDASQRMPDDRGPLDAQLVQRLGDGGALRR